MTTENDPSLLEADNLEAALERKKKNFVCPMCKADSWLLLNDQRFYYPTSWRYGHRIELSGPRFIPVHALRCQCCGFIATFDQDTLNKFVHDQDN